MRRPAGSTLVAAALFAWIAPFLPLHAQSAAPPAAAAAPAGEPETGPAVGDRSGAAAHEKTGGNTDGKAGDGKAVRPRRKKPDLSHTHQIGIGVVNGIGYRAIVPYEERRDCGDRTGDFTKRVCVAGVPTFLDMQLSFGMVPQADVIFDLRLGLGQDFTASHQVMLLPGFRFWIDPAERLKFFATVQLAYDLTEQHTTTVRSTDWGIRNANGVAVDVIRNVGFYLQFGEILGLARWFSFAVDIGVGAQARWP